MKKNFFILLLAFGIIGCSDGLETVQNKDEAGNLLEEYTRRTDDFAKEGLYIKYDSSGNKMIEANYINDTLHGKQTQYYSSGQPQYVEHYKNGQFEGEYIAYYENGQIKQKGQYENGKMNGNWKRYYENGQLMEDVPFVDNQESGTFIEYHANGKLKAEGAYLNGDREHGLLKLYDENGELERKMNCDKGICRTIWKKEETQKGTAKETKI